MQSCPAISNTHLQTAAGSTCSLLCSLSLTGFFFYYLFFFTKGLDVILTCKNKSKNLPEELLMGYHPLSRYRRYYYGHPSQLQMEVKQIPLHISVQSFTITPISF